MSSRERFRSQVLHLGVSSFSKAGKTSAYILDIAKHTPAEPAFPVAPVLLPHTFRESV